MITHELGGTGAHARGSAPGAKVAFTDLGDSDGLLWTPSDLNTGYFPRQYHAGAHQLTHCVLAAYWLHVDWPW